MVRPGGVLVRTSYSLISVGTESASITTGGGENLVMKAIRNPALVSKVMQRVSSSGLKDTAALVLARMSADLPAGYSCAGTVLEVGAGVSRFRVGDRVACCGVGYANHAGVNFVPQNLVAKMPDNVSFEEGAFGTIGAIALQGIRRCAPTLGERVVVLGLGLLGQITAQLLKSAGADVIGVDVKADRVGRAEALGLPHGFAVTERDFNSGVFDYTQGRGADAVIVTAAGGDACLLNQCFDVCRRKARVVLVGDVPIKIQRDKIYKKELDFLISTSYGPGRYDSDYEEKGIDYPLAYVRWTEGRNLEEVLRQISIGQLQVKPLIDKTHPIAQAEQAYASIAMEPRPIGVLLDYGREEQAASAGHWYLGKREQSRTGTGKIGVGVIGYGGYFRGVLLPALKEHSGFHLHAVCARNPLSVRVAVEKDGFQRGTTNYQELLDDASVRLVYIATRHDQHFEIARDAILASKAVFVEKPMTMTAQQGRELCELVEKNNALLTVGFNRRFSPHSVALKQAVDAIGAPKTMLYRVNAGPLPPEHWLLDPIEGGGRLLGEGVHFFDFLRFLAGSNPVRIEASFPGGKSRDQGAVTIQFADGSVGTLIYASDGSVDSGKELVEVFAGGASFILNDYRSLEVHGAKQKGTRGRKIEKGQKEQLQNLYAALRGQADLGVTAEDGYWATYCAEQAVGSL